MNPIPKLTNQQLPFLSRLAHQNVIPGNRMEMRSRGFFCLIKLRFRFIWGLRQTARFRCLFFERYRIEGLF